MKKNNEVEVKMKKSLLFLPVFLVFCLSTLQCKKLVSPEPKPEDVGMSSKHLKLINGIVKEAVVRRDFPGAVVLVSRKGKVVFREAYGESQWIPSKRKMEVAMLFDLASLTKPIATATSIMILVEQGRLNLTDKVKDFIPDFSPYVDEKGTQAGDASIWHLLTHTSGLPPYTNAAEIKEKYGSPCPLDSLIRHIAQLRKSNPPGEAFNYSCLGFISLAYILQKITGQTIAEFSEKHIFKPLKMKHTFFKPPQKYRDICVPTEIVEEELLTGIVHDPLARLQDGISGNAGLFSTADDLAIFAQMMLNEGEVDGVRILSPLTVERMTSIFPRTSFSGRGLGWDIDSSYSTCGGDIFGLNSYGHTGYTGTSIWIDPDTETFLIFLTNRVHPEDKGEIVSIRSKLANIVASSIIKK